MTHQAKRWLSAVYDGLDKIPYFFTHLGLQKQGGSQELDHEL